MNETASPDDGTDGTDGDAGLQALVDEEFSRIRALLAAADLSVPITSSTRRSSVPGARHEWVLRAPGRYEAEISLCPDAADAASAVEHLLATESPPDDDGLPAVGQNGRLVYVVRHLEASGDRTAVYETLDLAGALGGEVDE